MAIAVTVVGFVLVVLGVQDAFFTLFHPAGRGALSDWIGDKVWRAFRPLARRRRVFLKFAGPAAFVAITGSWGSMVVFGFALVYLAYIGTGFDLVQGIDPRLHQHFIDALNISIGALITLYGDFFARSSWIRLLLGIEAVIGFGLLTAMISWLLSIYPALEDRRALAESATILHNAELKSGVDPTRLPPGEAQAILATLTSGLIGLRNQMAQFPITYYFHMGEPETALGGILPYVARLAARASAPDRPPGVRLAGVALGGAVESLLRFIAGSYLEMPPDNPSAILRAYAEDQMDPYLEDDESTRRAA
jgi:hypothetical protein